MPTHKKLFIYIPALLITGILAGCSAKKVILQNTQTLPLSYSTGTDTTTIARLPINQLFADTNLIRLIDTALRANPDIQTALQKVEVSSAGIKYARSFLLPSLEFNATAGLERFGSYTMNGVGNYDTNLSPNINGKQTIPNPTADFFVGFRSSWEVDLWGKLGNSKKAAFSRFLASRSGYRLVVTTLTAQIATLYYQLLALDNEQGIIDRNIQLQQRALEIIKIQKLGGRATELAVQQFNAQLLRTKGLRFTTAQQITETENQLKFLTGSFNRPIQRDTSISTLKLPGVISAGVPSQLLLNRPDIRQAELELTALNADIKAARAAFLPSLTFSPYVGYNAFKAELLFNPLSIVYGLIGGVTAPIFNRGRIKANYARTVAEGKQALYAYQKTILSGFLEVMNSLNGIDNANKYYELKKQEVSSLKNAVDISNNLFLVGRASYLEIITAQRNVLDAELDLANTKKNIFLNTINLYKAVGGGWH